MWYAKLALLLTVIGGLNWGLVGLFDFNLVTFLFGATFFTPLTYVLVGLSSIYTFFYYFTLIRN